MQDNQLTHCESINDINMTPTDCFFSQASNFEVKITQDASELNKAKKLRLKNYSRHKPEPSSKKSVNHMLATKKLIEEQQRLIHDGYDSYADHLVVIDLEHNNVVAYVRLIDAFTAYQIGGYYNETQFNLNKLFNNQTFYLEISRLVIDPNYNNRETTSLLWSGIIQHAQGKNIDSIIGSLSLSMNQGADSYIFLNQLKKYAMSDSRYRVQPYQLLPDNDSSLSGNERVEHPVIEYFFEQGVKLCGDAYWNKNYNSAELFIHYPINNSALFPECIRKNEIQLGLIYE